jgi:hypothetical protein
MQVKVGDSRKGNLERLPEPLDVISRRDAIFCPHGVDDLPWCDRINGHIDEGGAN